MSLGPEAQREAVRPGSAPPIFLLTSNLTLRLAVPIFWRFFQPSRSWRDERAISGWRIDSFFENVLTPNSVREAGFIDHRGIRSLAVGKVVASSRRG